MGNSHRCLPGGVVISLLVTITVQVLPEDDIPGLTREALAQIENLQKQYDQQKGALDDLASRHARFEVLHFYESRCNELRRRIGALQAGVDGWKAKAAGNEGRANELLSVYESFKKEDARRNILRQYCGSHEAARMAKEQPRRDEASKAIVEVEKGWDEALRNEARAIAGAYLDMRAAQAAFDLMEFTRLMVRRRVLEDRVHVIDRARYYLDNLRGPYIPNADFDSQYDELWRKLLGTPAAEASKELSSTVSAARQSIHMAGEKLSEAKRTFVLSYLDSDIAVAAMDLNQLIEVATGAKRGANLLRELKSGLDALDSRLQPTLARLGYDARLEERRPITFDKTGNPSDVVLILDSRAGDYAKVLEGDATTMTTDAAGASVLSLQLDEKGNISYKPSTGGPPDVSKSDLYQSYLVVLLGGNTNRALPESFWKDASPEMLAQNAAGDRSARTVDIWHPRVREYTGSYFEAVGRALRSDPRFLLYDHVTWEPTYSVPPKERKSPTFGYAIQPGRSEIAIKAFRGWLQSKFRTVEKLNAAWRSSYKSFDEIAPPPDPFMEWRRRATPLSYEHETFLHESIADYVGLACGAIMKGDSDHPVIFEMPGDMDNSIEACFANVPLLTRVPAQMVEMHKNNFWPALPVQVYAATVIPMYGKIPVHTEFIWNWGRRSTPSDESETYSQGLQAIWRNVAHGVRVLFPFAWDEWPSYENGYTDWFITKDWQPGWRTRVGAIYRDSIACLAVGARRARRFGELLRETKLGPREVAIVQPSTSTTNAYPYYSLSWSFNVHTIEAKSFHDLLFNKNYQYGYVPEEAFYDGHADMDDYPVLILPYASYFPDGFAEKLLRYVKRGGVVICSGAPGLYDKYGRDDGSFLRDVFGELKAEYSGNDYIWQFEITPVKPKAGCDVLVPDGKNALLLRARYGRGTVLVSSIPFGQRPRSQLLVPHFYRAVDDALAAPIVKCTYDRFEVVVRERGKRRFLFVCNYSLTNTLEDLITAKGEYRQLIDHGISGAFRFLPLPRTVSESLKMPVDHGVFYMNAQGPPGCTSFWMKLQPGEVTVLELLR